MGPVWFTEYVEHEAKGRSVEMVEVGETYDQQEKITILSRPVEGGLASRTCTAICRLRTQPGRPGHIRPVRFRTRR